MKNLFILFYSVIFSSHLFLNQLDGKSVDQDSTTSVTISFVGDLMCHSPQFKFAQVSQDSFDFKPAFREIKKYLTKADLTIGNLETTISGKESRYSGYPLFNSPNEYLEALKDAGFDILLTANNHSLDRGKKGALRTMDMIKNNGMESIGSYHSQQDRDSIRVFGIKGIKIAILSYTYGLNGNYIAKNEKYLVNVIDTTLMKQDILNARNKNADVILVYFHFGDEYQCKPNSFQKEIVKRAIDYGADLIIGSHPHVIQPVEYFSSIKNKIGKGLIAYSLGNFISNQRWRYSDAGVILNITITKNILTQDIKLTNETIITTWVFKGKKENKNQFVILPVDSTTINSLPNYLTESDRVKLLQSEKDTRKILEEVQNNSIKYMNKKVE
ncbi:MAG: CapA family protein [Ignavibacteriales bacterium]|nr:CapA family protein [Ignavibacteriales bacterium]